MAPKSEEHRAVLAAATKAKWENPEHRAKMLAAFAVRDQSRRRGMKMPKKLCDRCEKQIGVTGYTRHRKSCITSLSVFIEEHSNVIALDRETGCLIWSGRVGGGKNGDPGYARLGNHKRVTRVLLEFFLGRPLLGRHELACHTCDNSRCVNWWHLWPGSNFDNAQDMIAKGRAGWQKQ